MLAGDPALAAAADRAAAGRPAAGARPRRPRQLPAAVPHFTGRAAELAALTGLLDQAGEQAPGTVVISAIGGTAGVGQDGAGGALGAPGRGPVPGRAAVREPARLRPRPAGDGRRRAGRVPARAGRAGQDIPPELEERAARYRSLLAGRRMLVVLDNARDGEQVRPLLPGAPGCVVAGHQPGRADRPGRPATARPRLDLDLLPPADAVGLLRALIGARADADPAAAAALAERARGCRWRCGWPPSWPPPAPMPAGRAGRRAGRPAAAAGPAGRRRRPADRGPGRVLLVLPAPDAAAARAFRLLGLHPGPDLDAYAAAALTGTTAEQAAGCWASWPART